MKFHEVSLAFNQIEPITSRLEITRLLSELFLKANAQEAQIISYLCLGTLKPAYASAQFNFAEKSAIKVIAKLLNLADIEVKNNFKQVGDLGLIIEKGNWKNEYDLTIVEVYDRLISIQNISGVGSQELRLETVIQLLKEVDPISAKYIIRILTATLRLGFSDMTLLDAFSWMLVGNKSLRKDLENSYNFCADIGLIAYHIKENGIEGAKELKVHLGIPIRMAAAERLPNAQEIFNKLGNCIAQPKLDGFRLQVHVNNNQEQVIKLFSRNLLDMSHMFPDLIDAIKKIKVNNLIAEGEAVAFDPHTGIFHPFQETVKRKRKHDIETIKEELPLKLYFFDLLFVEGKPILNLTHEQRRQKLKDIFEDVDPILNVIEEINIKSATQLEEYFNECISAGLEGLIVKRPEANYQPGKRNFNWIKLKRVAKGELIDTIDCVVLGYYYGSGRRAKFAIGAFLVGIYNKDLDNFQTIAKVGSGLTDQGLIELKSKCDKIKVEHKPKNVDCFKHLEPDVWVNPEIVVQIFADEITMSPVHTAGKTDKNLGFALRFPRFIDYRIDKSAEETTSVKELEELYDMQYKKK